MKKNNTVAHNNLKNTIIVAIYEQYHGNCFACGRSVGTYRSMDGKRIVHTGIKGEPDIYALIKGKSFFIEVKTGTGKLREEQKKFRDNIIKAGGHFIEARDLYDVMAEIEKIV